MLQREPRGTEYVLDTNRVDHEFDHAVLSILPSSLVLARRVRERVGPDRYALEWNLPGWIGNSFRVQPSICARFTVANVIGLAALRLRDDIEDGDVDAQEVPAASLLSDGLLDASLSLYRELFPPTSPLWPRLTGWLSAWQAATREAASSEHADRLATRAEPMKISAYGLCLLAERSPLFPTIEACLDLTLEAMVLFDHLCDWQEDIEANRWNAFVTHVNTVRPIANLGPTGSTNVYVALLSTDAAATYADEIHERMGRAVALADDCDLVPLARHLSELDARIRDHSGALRTHYRVLAERATALFGSRKENGNEWR